MAKTSKTVPQKVASSSSQSIAEVEETIPDVVVLKRSALGAATDEPASEPPLKMFVPGGCSVADDSKVEKPSSVQGRCEAVYRYICSITEDVLLVVRKDCGWADKDVVVPRPEDAITSHVESYLSVYTYPFTLGPVDSVILDFCKRYEVCLGQIHPLLWRIVIFLRYFVNKIESCQFTIDHLLRLYSPRIFRGGLIKLTHRASKAPFSSIDEDWDRGWQRRFVRVKTADLIHSELMPFREKWNVSRNNNFPLNVDFTFISFFLTSICGGAVVARVPNAIPRFKEWIEGICSKMPCSERRWRNLSKGRWEARSHGLPKTIELRPSVWDEDLSVDPFALGQLGVATGDRGRHNIDRTGKTDRTDNFGFFRFFGRFVVYIFKKFGDRFGFRFWCPNFRLNRKTEILVYRFWWALLHL
ncbi:uncharacterized protein LOC142177979 [Nicotiana tabacum]|uniref:Uncharacterized protein LOC142177979 n=1 Tax=Nicotiana tabacum TaxID=4097 RepID=A0AC58U1H2_TOBAC